VVHEWHPIGGVRLQIKELQTFKSETILSLFNIFTSTNKKILLAELQEILMEAQSQVQEQDATEFWWSSEDTGPKSTLPAFELRSKTTSPGYLSFQEVELAGPGKLVSLQCRM
jgi:hypothetical protein